MPVFVLDDRLLDGRHASGSRDAVHARVPAGPARARCSSAAGTSCVVRGTPERELPKLAREHGATRGLLRLRRLAVRDARATGASRRRCARRASSRAARPGNFVADIGKPKPYAVFTPFWRAWQRAAAARGPRRAAHGPRRRRTCAVGEIPTRAGDRGPGPAAGRRDAPAASACTRWLRDGIDATPSATTGSPAARRCSRPTCTSAASQRARARGARRPPRRLHPPARLARLLRPRPPAPPGQRAPRLPARARRDRVGRRATSTSTPGARAARAIPSSTPACASSPRPAGCTTAPG